MASASRWVVLGVAIVGFVQTHLHRMAFAPLIPTFVAELGLSYTAAGSGAPSASSSFPGSRPGGAGAWRTGRPPSRRSSPSR